VQVDVARQQPGAAEVDRAATWRKASADCGDNPRLDLHPAARYHTGRRDDAGAGQDAHKATARPAAVRQASTAATAFVIDVAPSSWQRT